MKRYFVVAAGVALAALVAVGLHSQLTSANDIAHYQTYFDTDVAAAGYGGMRGIGTGTIHLTGVSGTVDQALLFWQGPTTSDSSQANAVVTFAGEEITGTNIGFSDDNCWGFDNSQAYRADVTSLVTGSGDYALADFIKGVADINGVSLIVFFDDGNDTNNRDVVLFDGNDSNIPNIYDADGWNVSLSGINYTSGSVRMDLHVGDGQIWDDDALVLNGVTTIAPTGAIFQGESVPNGAGDTEETQGGLWDIKSYTVTGQLTPGPNTLTLTTGSFEDSDCLSLVVAAVDLPAGAAPTEEPTAAPARSHHKHVPKTPTPEPTDTSAPPTATHLPPTLSPPPIATASGGAGPLIVMPNTGEGAETGAGLPWTPVLGLLAVAGATTAAGVLARLMRSSRR